MEAVIRAAMEAVIWAAMEAVYTGKHRIKIITIHRLYTLRCR